MKVTYNEESKYHEIDGKGTLILTKNNIGLEIKNLENFNFLNIHIEGQWGRFGKIKQLIKCIKFIFSR